MIATYKRVTSFQRMERAGVAGEDECDPGQPQPAGHRLGVHPWYAMIIIIFIMIIIVIIILKF